MPLNVDIQRVHCRTFQQHCRSFNVECTTIDPFRTFNTTYEYTSKFSGHCTVYSTPIYLLVYIVLTTQYTQFTSILLYKYIHSTRIAHRTHYILLYYVVKVLKQIFVLINFNT